MVVAVFKVAFLQKENNQAKPTIGLWFHKVGAVLSSKSRCSHDMFYPRNPASYQLNGYF